MSFAGQYPPVRLRSFLLPARRRPGGLGYWGLATPCQFLSRGSRRASQVPGEPPLCLRPVLRPRRDRRHQAIRCVGAAPVRLKTKARRGWCSRGSIARLGHSLSTLRGARYRDATQDSLPAAGQALPGGLAYPQGSSERFPRSNRYISSPFPKLAWRNNRSRVEGDKRTWRQRAVKLLPGYFGRSDRLAQGQQPMFGATSGTACGTRAYNKCSSPAQPLGKL
jgi:hypothetical protein